MIRVQHVVRMCARAGSPEACLIVSVTRVSRLSPSRDGVPVDLSPSCQHNLLQGRQLMSSWIPLPGRAHSVTCQGRTGILTRVSGVIGGGQSHVPPSGVNKRTKLKSNQIQGCLY